MKSLFYNMHPARVLSCASKSHQWCITCTHFKQGISYVCAQQWCCQPALKHHTSPQLKKKICTICYPPITDVLPAYISQGQNRYPAVGPVCSKSVLSSFSVCCAEIGANISSITQQLVNKLCPFCQACIGDVLSAPKP